MTIAHNDITGDLLKTKGSNDAYREGWDRIFGPKKKTTIIETPEPTEEVIYHLRSYGDVSKEDLDAYLARNRSDAAPDSPSESSNG